MKRNEYYKIVKSRAEVNMCDGSCYNGYGHSGSCEVYEVFDYTDKSWGLFSYCDNAVKKRREQWVYFKAI